VRQKIPVSEARAQLSQLLKRLQAEPDIVFEITVNSMVLGELRAPEAAQFRVKPGGSLLKAMEEMGEPEVPVPGSESIAREHDRYLYSRDS